MGVTSTQVVKFIRKGDKGDKGEQGAVLRGPQAWSDCAVDFAFKAGETGDAWKDVVLYNGNYYSCVKSHAKTSSNYPGSSADQASGYWQLGDKIELVATKILLATYALVQNLGVEAIDMRDGDGNILFQAKDGNVTCKTGTFENVVISGTLQGVSGSFNSLDCVDSSGKKVGGIRFGSDGTMWLNGDLYHQGYDFTEGRSHRFYASDFWCRGQFGAHERNVLVVNGSYGYYYTKGMSGSGAYISLAPSTDSQGNTYYRLSAFGSGDDYAGPPEIDYSGFPVDVIVFKITSSTVFNYLLAMSDSQRLLLVNANDDQNNVRIYQNGSLAALSGGCMREVCKLYTFQYPQVASDVLGAGIFLGAVSDNNW